MTQHNEFDLAVVGTGGAAMSAAIHARLEGASVVAIESGTLGGTCVNVGCVPSKTLLAAAHTRHAALTNPFPGAATSAGAVDLGALVQQKDELVGMLRQTKYADIAAAYGFDILPGTATFTDPSTLLVDGRPVRAKSYLIATGAEPTIPTIPGLEQIDYLTSTTAMELTELPASLVVIGGGFVGLEQAQLFARLGVEVTIIGRLAPHAEPELSSELRKAFLTDGITVIGDRAATITPHDDLVRVLTRTGKVATGERVLVATGRTPRTDGLGLATAGIATDTRGFIIVDEQQRTTNPAVFAAGDVTDVPQYVYVAARTGKIAAHNALGHSEQVDYTGLPSVLFTSPQLASAGITEAEAIAAGYRCACRYLRLADVPRAIANHNTRGGIKIVADADTGKVLGVHALADTAGEMMLAATYAIKAKEISSPRSGCVGSGADTVVEPERVNPRLGAHLRAAREASGLTLKALGDSMGVTPSLLSQIENDKVQPSLNTLYQLVSRLNLSIDSLLDGGDGRIDGLGTRGVSGASARPTVQRAGENPTLVLGTGVSWERLAGGLEETLEPLIITFPPHATSSPTDGLLQYSGYEFGLLLEGQLTLKLGFESYELNAGDSVHFDAFRPHAYVNESDEPARGVWFVLRDEFLRMRARLGPLRPVFGSVGSANAPQSAWNTVDQTDW